MDEHHITHTRGSLILLADLGTWFLKIFPKDWPFSWKNRQRMDDDLAVIGSLTRLFEKPFRTPTINKSKLVLLFFRDAGQGSEPGLSDFRVRTGSLILRTACEGEITYTCRLLPVQFRARPLKRGIVPALVHSMHNKLNGKKKFFVEVNSLNT
jgi:hypothetical protein